MSQNNNAQELLSASMQNLRELVDVNTVVGEPITTPDGTTIIPISKVSFGFASGGSDFPSKAENKMFGGGGGGGVFNCQRRPGEAFADVRQFGHGGQGGGHGSGCHRQGFGIVP